MQLHFLVTSEQRTLGAMFFKNLNQDILAFVYPTDTQRTFHTFFCPPMRIVALNAEGDVLFDEIISKWRFVMLPACRTVIETGPQVDYRPYVKTVLSVAPDLPQSGALDASVRMDGLLFALLAEAVSDIRRIREAHQGEVNPEIQRRKFEAWERGQIVSINDLVMVIDEFNVGFCLGTGSGNFGTFVSLNVSTGMYALWVGDVDNDGLTDIFYGVDSFGSLEYLAWCKNQGGAVFSSPVEITNPFPMQELELLDVNGVAALDIVYVTGDSETGGYIFYHLNNGTGSFANSPTSINYWTQPDEILPYDFNGDGFDEFVYISQNTGITIAMNDADLSFSDHVIPNSHFLSEYYDIELADLENDSDPDILAGLLRF